MDFAPYQSSPPETNRALSPPVGPKSPRTSADLVRSFSPFQQPSPPPLQHPQPQRNWQPSLPGSFPAANGHREGVSEFDTSLGIRLDYEACLAYLAFPPLGAILLLIGERNSDYVRYVLGCPPVDTFTTKQEEQNFGRLTSLDSTPGNRAFFLPQFSSVTSSSRGPSFLAG